jgi:hypothetical protein
VKSLGVVAYGIVPLALVINQYINVISLSLVNALTRFYSVEYRNGNYDKASKYFSTSIVVGIIFSLILYPFLHIGVKYIDYFFDIPTSLLADAKLLFRLTIASFFLSILSNCINTTLFADNLLDYVNYLKIARQSLKFLLNVGLFILLQTNIEYVGFANLATEALILILSIYFYKKTRPREVHFQISLYNRTYLLTMLAMLAWVLLQRFSDTFLYKIDSILMNVFFGIKMTGRIGAISEFSTYVVSITTVLSSLFSPLLLIYYSKKKFEDYKLMTIEGTYIVGLFSGLLCGLLCGSSSTLLKIWLGSEFQSYGSWLILKIIVIPYTTVGALYANSYLYANKNKKPAIVSLLLAIGNILTNIVLLHIFNSVTIFLVTCSLFVLFQGLLMNLWFYNRLYEGGGKIILFDTLKYTMYTLLISFLMAFIDSLFSIHSIFELLSVYILLFAVGLFLIDTIFLKTSHRQLLKEIIPVYDLFRKKIIYCFKNKVI